MVYFLMVLPITLQVLAFGWLIYNHKGLTSDVWRVGRNILIASVIAKAAYVAVISVQLDFAWHRVFLIILMAAVAYLWHKIYKAKKTQEANEADRKAKYAAYEAKKLAKDLDFPWPDQLTHERETARLMSEVEDAWKKEK